MSLWLLWQGHYKSLHTIRYDSEFLLLQNKVFDSEMMAYKNPSSPMWLASTDGKILAFLADLSFLLVKLHTGLFGKTRWIVHLGNIRVFLRQMHAHLRDFVVKKPFAPRLLIANLAFAIQRWVVLFGEPNFLAATKDWAFVGMVVLFVELIASLRLWG